MALKTEDPSPAAAMPTEKAQRAVKLPEENSGERYQRLPTGAHGLAREEVERDQRQRLQRAMIELIAQRGYPAVRILDLTKLAHVWQPTFYSLYTDKEGLLLDAYDDIAARTAKTVIKAYNTDASLSERLRVAMRAFAELAAVEPDAMSLFLFGALGAGPKTLERRKRNIEALEQRIESIRDGSSSTAGANLTAKVILGGIREVAAARLVRRRGSQLPGLADELAAWAASYSLELPARLADPSASPAARSSPRPAPGSERA